MGSKVESRDRDQLAGRKHFKPEDLFGGRVYTLNLVVADNDTKDTVFFITDADGYLRELATTNARGDTAFFDLDGGVVEYGADDDAPRVVQRGKKDSGIDCDKFVKSVNSAVAACARAMCDLVNCEFAGICGGLNSFEHQQRMRAFCLRPTQGVIQCSDCDE